MRGYVSDLLGRMYQIEAVSDGQAALEAARREPPALIISDVMMPRLDGLGLLQALRADHQAARCAGDPAVGARRRGSAHRRPEHRRRRLHRQAFQRTRAARRESAHCSSSRTRAARARSGAAASSRKPRGRRTNSSPCWRTSCAIRWRRSAMPANCCRAACRPTCRCARPCRPSSARSRTWPGWWMTCSMSRASRREESSCGAGRRRWPISWRARSRPSTR